MQEETAAGSEEMGALCGELESVAKKHGMLLTSAQLKEGNVLVNCVIKYEPAEATTE